MKHCPNCGIELDDAAVVCVGCGTIISESAELQQNETVASAEGQPVYNRQQTYNQSYNQQPAYNQQPYNQQAYNQSYNQQAYNPGYNQSAYNQQSYNTSPMGYECSTIPILSIVFAFLYPIAGLVLGVIGLIRSKQKSNKTMSLIGLLVSIIPFILFLVGIFALITILVEIADYGYYF